ncbi:MAG: hypothetical protein JSU08_18835 [Acidobacteria bacterium]|nr:hypothetical protein [Acidobacteriota bacterium]
MNIVTRSLVVGLVAGAALASTPASAQSGPWSVSFDLGAQTALSGDVHGAGTGRVLNLPTVVNAKSYGDIYGPGFYWAAGVGYKVRTNGELRVQGSYTANPADRVQVGTVANLALFAQFDDYKAFGMDLGYRQYYGASKLRPFAGASVGFTRVDTINSTFTVPAAGVTLAAVPMNASSTVPSFGLQGGAQYHLNDRLALQAGADFRWHGNLKQNEGLAGTGLEGINDKTRRWALPITAGLTLRF